MGKLFGNPPHSSRHVMTQERFPLGYQAWTNEYQPPPHQHHHHHLGTVRHTLSSHVLSGAPAFLWLWPLSGKESKCMNEKLVNKICSHQQYFVCVNVLKGWNKILNTVPAATLLKERLLFLNWKKKERKSSAMFSLSTGWECGSKNKKKNKKSLFKPFNHPYRIL